MCWNDFPSSVKNSETIIEFKFKLKRGRKIHCTCNARRWEFIAMFPNYVSYLLSSLHAKYLLKNILLFLYENGSTCTPTFNKNDQIKITNPSKILAKCAFA